MASYDAFISYSHGADGRLAPALHQALHRFAKPWHRARAVRVFRDQTNLALAHNLPETLTGALDGASHFLLLASPAAAQSKWVNAEATYWLAHKGAERILIVLTEGEIHWDEAASDFDWKRTDALPGVLRGSFKAEPLYLDLRWTRLAENFSARDPRFVDAVARISAILRGMSLDEIAGEDVRQHRRTRRIAAAAVASIVAFALAAAAGGVYAWRQQVAALAARDAEAEQRREAERQRAEADRRRAEAEQRRNEALAAQSRFLAETAHALADRGDFEQAALILLEALPGASAPRPLVAEAAAAMRRVLASDPLRLVLRGHQGGILQLVSVPGTRAVASLGRDGTVRLWDRANGRALRSWRGDDSAALSQDGRIAVFLAASDVEVWSLVQQRRLRTLENVEDGANSICISPDGVRLVAWTATGDASVWNLETGARLVRFKGGRRMTEQRRCLFSADGSRVASIWLEGFQVWTVADGATVGVHTGSNFGTFALLDRDGRRLITTRNYGFEIDVWDVAGGRRLSELSGHASNVTALALDRDGTRLASGGQDNVVRLWDIALGRQLAVLQGHEGPVVDAIFSPNGAQIATGSQDRTARIWDARTARQIASFASHEGPVGAVAFADGPAQFLTGTATGVVRLWDVREQTRAATDIARAAWTLRRTNVARFSPDGRLLLTAEVAAAPSVRDAKTLQIRSVLSADKRGLMRAFWSPLGRLIAGQQQSGAMRIWRAVDGAALTDIALHRDSAPDPRSVAFDKREARILIWHAGTNPESVVSLYEIPSGRLLTRQTAALTATGGDQIVSIAFVDDQPVYFTTDRSASVRMRSLSDASVLKTFSGHASTPEAAWVTRDGSRLVTVSAEDGRVWDVRGGHATAAFALAHGEFLLFSEVGVVSRDGRFLALHAHDNAPRVWDLDSGRRVSTLRGHAAITQSLAISPDSGLVAAGASDGHVIVWQTATGTPVASIPGPLSFPLHLAWSEEPGRLLRVATTQSTATLFEIGSYAGDHALDRTLLEWRTTRALEPAERKRFGLQRTEAPAPAPPSCASLAGHPLDPRAQGEPAAADIAEPAAAAEACRKAVAAAPDDPRHRYRLARALVFAERQTEAAAVLQHASLAAYPRALDLLALLFESGKGVRRDAKRARALYETSHALGDVLAGCALAAMLFSDGDAARARAVLEETATRASPCAHERLALLFLHGGADPPPIGAALAHAVLAAALWQRAGFSAPAARARALRANLARRVSIAEAREALRILATAARPGAR